MWDSEYSGKNMCFPIGTVQIKVASCFIDWTDSGWSAFVFICRKPLLS